MSLWKAERRVGAGDDEIRGENNEVEWGVDESSARGPGQQTLLDATNPPVLGFVICTNPNPGIGQGAKTPKRSWTKGHKVQRDLDKIDPLGGENLPPPIIDHCPLRTCARLIILSNIWDHIKSRVGTKSLVGSSDSGN